ncbi:hypothetical protein JXA48_02215 [Candidatus Woesearchaeota archaeon]|nr:hypothetical protein [Candidatus Woesearchaeota archaeon]
MKNITTGIDRLLQLVEERKKISAETAAKELNLGKDVIEEWAEILEQEKIVNLSFKFSKMHIEAKKITERTVFDSAKQISSQKEAFHRKIESTIKSIDNESAGFEEIRSEFEKIQGHIKDELETVRKEMKELEHFDALKKNIEKDIQTQKKDYELFTKAYDEEMKTFEKNYSSSIEKLKKEQDTLKKLQDSIVGLRSDKQEIEKIIKESLQRLKDVEKKADEQIVDMKQTEKTIDKLKKEIDGLSTNIKVSRAKNLKTLAKIVGEGRERITKDHENLLKNAQSKVTELKDYADAGEKIYKKFSDKFMKKIETGDLISEIEKEKNDLKDELIELDKKVQTFNALKGSVEVKDQFKEIEAKIFSYEEKRHKLSDKINKLLGMMK